MMEMVWSSGRPSPHDDLVSSLSKLNVNDNIWSFPTQDWELDRRKQNNPQPEAQKQVHGHTSLGILSRVKPLHASRLPAQEDQTPDTHIPERGFAINSRLAARLHGFDYETPILRRAVKKWKELSASSNFSECKECLPALNAAVDECVQVIVDGCPTAVRSRADTLFAFACFLGSAPAHPLHHHAFHHRFAHPRCLQAHPLALPRRLRRLLPAAAGGGGAGAPRGAAHAA